MIVNLSFQNSDCFYVYKGIFTLYVPSTANYARVSNSVAQRELLLSCMRATGVSIPSDRDLKAMGTTKRTLYTQFDSFVLWS